MKTYVVVLIRSTSVMLLNKDKRLGVGVCSAPDFRSQGPWFKSRWRRNSVYDCMALHCTEPFIIILPLICQKKKYDLNNVQRDVNAANHHQIFPFSGSHCEVSSSYCTLSEVAREDPPACHNEGTCYGLDKNFSCTCLPGFTGTIHYLSSFFNS